MAERSTGSSGLPGAKNQRIIFQPKFVTVSDLVEWRKSEIQSICKSENERSVPWVGMLPAHCLEGINKGPSVGFWTKKKTFSLFMKTSSISNRSTGENCVRTCRNVCR